MELSQRQRAPPQPNPTGQGLCGGWTSEPRVRSGLFLVAAVVFGSLFIWGHIGVVVTIIGSFSIPYSRWASFFAVPIVDNSPSRFKGVGRVLLLSPLTPGPFLCYKHTQVI